MAEGVCFLAVEGDLLADTPVGVFGLLIVGADSSVVELWGYW